MRAQRVFLAAQLAQANHPDQSLHLRYSNIGYGNKLRIDLKASFTPATARQPFTSRRHEPYPSCRAAGVHENGRSYIITLNDTRYELVTSALREILER